MHLDNILHFVVSIKQNIRITCFLSTAFNVKSLRIVASGTPRTLVVARWILVTVSSYQGL